MKSCSGLLRQRVNMSRLDRFVDSTLPLKGKMQYALELEHKRFITMALATETIERIFEWYVN